MKVKIGNTIYDADKEPIMLIFTPEDKENIAHMDEFASKFCAFPAGKERKEIEEFMETSKSQEHAEK